MIKRKFSKPRAHEFTNFTEYVSSHEKSFVQLHADCNRSLFNYKEYFDQAGFSPKIGQVIFERFFVDAFANTPESAQKEYF